MGNSNALNSLGVMYNEGKGVDQDYKKAFESFKKAADMGDANALNSLNKLKELM